VHIVSYPYLYIRLLGSFVVLEVC